MLEPTDELRLLKDLVAHPGWKLLEERIREFIFRTVGAEDGKTLDGMRRVIVQPHNKILELESKLKLT